MCLFDHTELGEVIGVLHTEQYQGQSKTSSSNLSAFNGNTLTLWYVRLLLGFLT